MLINRAQIVFVQRVFPFQRCSFLQVVILTAFWRLGKFWFSTVFVVLFLRSFSQPTPRFGGQISHISFRTLIIKFNKFCPIIVLCFFSLSSSLPTISLEQLVLSGKRQFYCFPSTPASTIGWQRLRHWNLGVMRLNRLRGFIIFPFAGGGSGGYGNLGASLNRCEF